MLIDLWNVVENAKLARSVHQILAFDGCWVGASGVQSHFMDQPQQSSDTELSGIPLDLGDPPRSSKAYFDNDDLNLKGYDFSFWFSTTYRIQRFLGIRACQFSHFTYFCKLHKINPFRFRGIPKIEKIRFPQIWGYSLKDQCHLTEERN